MGSVSILNWILGTILILSSLGVIFAKKPVYSSLFFLLTLLTQAGLFMELSAQFIAVMQILVYAGAILVIFMFVIVLFQDAYQQIDKYDPESSKPLLIVSAVAFIVVMCFVASNLISLPAPKEILPANYGTVQSLGRELYVDFFFPFEAVTLLFIVALIGALYTGKRSQEPKY